MFYKQADLWRNVLSSVSGNLTLGWHTYTHRERTETIRKNCMIVWHHHDTVLATCITALELSVSVHFRNRIIHTSGCTRKSTINKYLFHFHTTYFSVCSFVRSIKLFYSLPFHWTRERAGQSWTKKKKYAWIEFKSYILHTAQVVLKHTHKLCA